MPKCILCGRNIPKGEQYVVERIAKKTGNLRKENYCSKEEYDNILILREIKDNVYKKIDYFFGYTVINTLLKKEVEAIFKVYDPNLVLSFLDNNADYLYNVMGKSFVSEYAKIRYFVAIVNNRIKDYKDEQKTTPTPKINVEIIGAEDVVNTKFKTRKKRKSLDDIDI